MNEQYLAILKESLEKKSDVLDEIIRISRHQSEILAAQVVSYEDFDRCVDDKDVCIEQLNALDDGFETTYKLVEQELNANRGKYADWIRDCQHLISEVTEKSVEIQALEARNKQTIEAAFKKDRRAFSEGKRSVQVARNYYKNMNHTNVVPPQFVEKKI